MEKQKPVKRFFIGDISTSIWKNEGKNGSAYAITTSRRYQKDGKWHDTNSLRKYDLLKAIQLQARALSWIDYNEQSDSDEAEELQE